MALEIKKVNKTVIPKTTTPGRTRKPSEFDDVIEDAYQAWLIDPENAWFEVKYNGTKEDFELQSIEFTRAVAHMSQGKGRQELDEETGELIYVGYGKSIRGGYDDEIGEPFFNEEGEPVFWFQVRDKYKTGKRGPRKGINGDNYTDDELDAGLGDIEQSVADAKSSKRQRKSSSSGNDPVMVDHGVG